MTNQQMIEKLGTVPVQKIGKLPVVVLPLEDWQAIEALLEDNEMRDTSSYRRSVAVSRREVRQGKLYEFNLRTGAFRKTRSTA